MFEFDIILDKVGHLGRYQIVICGLVSWPAILVGVHTIAPVFHAADVPFR